jgi:VCBS repeat-containing protein
MGDEYEIRRFQMGNERPEPASARDVGALREFEAGACFAAGTLVHTQEGLKPIEQIKVGDMVLSKHEGGEGERAYKRVTKTFVHEEREVILIHLGGKQPDGSKLNKTLVVTPEHPIWIKGKGWKTADKLKQTLDFMYVEVLTDIVAKVMAKCRMYKSLKPDHAWIAAMDKMEFMNEGGLYIVPENKYSGEGAGFYDQSVPFKFRMKEEHLYKTTVYNLEVEDFHTYYVTEDGIWVHNKNITFNNPANGFQLASEVANKPFITGAEMYAYLRKNQIKAESGEYFIIRSKTPSPEARGYDPKSLDAAEVPKWGIHEENAPNRLVAPDGSRFEFAAPYFDPLYTGPGSQYRYLAIEGRLNGTTWVDQKLSLVKADDFDEALKLLYRTALRLKANPQESMVYQFNPAKDALGRYKKSEGLEAAGRFFQGIRDGDRFLRDTPGSNNGTRNELILEIIQIGRIRLQDAPLSQFVPQAVLNDGPGLATDRLSQQAIDALLPIAQQIWLDAGASPTAFAGLTVNMQELPSGFAAWTQAKTITLDTTGAGWGWYIDASPLDSSEFAVADAANAWHVDASEANNPAENRLDLLTALIHELGHVAGLTHSNGHSDGHTDIMSQYLAPGQRRLLSSEDVAALDPAHYLQTVVGVSTNTTGAANTASTYAALIVPSHWQSVHNTLANGSFSQGLAQWEQVGNAAFGQIAASTGNTVTLGESASTQAHVGQAFVLSAQDRFLTFTVSGLNLQTNSIEQNGVFTAAPQDAFEVALQNANTGVDLLADGPGNLGTNHSDARLNVQLGGSCAAATLQERAVSGLRHTDNADGSRTYVLDLSGIAAGTAVNLSFDLIGFGLTASQLGSKVNISDVRLISTPVAVNDATTLVEDGSATITVQANDLNAETAGFTPRLVASTQHGQVSVNAANGVFSGFVYTPDANFFGNDSFTYQYSNAAGTELSNTATVTLTVTPVNDAPVAADVSASTAEDTVATIDLVATDVDSAGAELQFAIQTQPGHGSVVKNADGSYSYTPAKDYNGADSFTYTVSDGSLTSNVATVRISITAVNDAPNLGNQALTVAEDTALNGNLLATASDVNSPVLTAAIVAGPQHGTLTVNANGTFSYQGSKDYLGADSFTYKVNDGSLATSLRPVILTQPAHGSVAVNANGTISYTPLASYAGLDSFTYATSDGIAHSTPQSRRQRGWAEHGG